MNSSTTFWIVAIAFVAIAMAFLLPPLLRRKPTAVRAGRRSINIAVYRDQLKEMEADLANGLLDKTQFSAAKQELETRLAEDAIDTVDESQPVSRGGRMLGYSLAGLLPIAAFGLYTLLGNPQAIEAIAAAQASEQVAGEHNIMDMIQKIEEKTRQEPNNGEAWTMLAKTYAAVGHWPEALHAYEKAYALRPDVAAVMTGYAEALAISNDRVLQGKPLELVLKALEVDPNDIKGLELAGISSFQQNNYAQAAYYFKRLHKLLPPDSPYAQDIAAAQQEAKRLSEQSLTGLDNLNEPAKAADAGATIKGEVDLDPALKDKVKPDDVVFLFARPDETGAPVAAIRTKAASFPLAFELNDAMAMNPDNRLSNHKTVNLTVRVAKSGDVKGAAGDLEGKLMAVKVGADQVKLIINQVRN